jgi:hypothetical protein
VYFSAILENISECYLLLSLRFFAIQVLHGIRAKPLTAPKDLLKFCALVTEKRNSAQLPENPK